MDEGPRGERWDLRDIPEEAYSRVTEPERFLPLHELMLGLLDALENRFNVEREEHDEPVAGGFGMLARRSVRLVPADPAAARLAVDFSSFPGLFLRRGHWLDEGYPRCGCDACDETAEQCWQAVEEDVEEITSGRIRVRLSERPHGEAWLETLIDGRLTHGHHFEADEVRALLEASGGRRDIQYAPWPRRATS